MSETPSTDISHDQHAVRRQKLADMRAAGFDPFRANVATTHFSQDAKALYVEGQDNAVTQLISATPGLKRVGLRNDLQGIPRTVVVQRT